MSLKDFFKEIDLKVAVLSSNFQIEVDEGAASFKLKLMKQFALLRERPEQFALGGCRQQLSLW